MAIATSAQWGTIREAAELYKLSEKTIRRYIASGDIEARRIGPRLIRVDISGLNSLGRSLNVGAHE